MATRKAPPKRGTLILYDVTDAPSSDPRTWPIAKNGAEPERDEALP